MSTTQPLVLSPSRALHLKDKHSLPTPHPSLISMDLAPSPSNGWPMVIPSLAPLKTHFPSHKRSLAPKSRCAFPTPISREQTNHSHLQLLLPSPMSTTQPLVLSPSRALHLKDKHSLPTPHPSLISMDLAPSPSNGWPMVIPSLAPLKTHFPSHKRSLAPKSRCAFPTPISREQTNHSHLQLLLPSPMSTTQPLVLSPSQGLQQKETP